VIANKLAIKLNNYRAVKTMVREELFDACWRKLEKHYLNSMEKYLRGGALILQNIRSVKKAEDASYYRLNIKHRRTLERYIKGLYFKTHYREKLSAIVKIQAFFRMRRLRRTFLDLKAQTLKIQKNWRKYYYDKQFNVEFTAQYFEDGPGGNLRAETEYWKVMLHRNL
jgi:hypothetical protein